MGWLCFKKDSRKCSAKLDLSDFQISSVYKLSNLQICVEATGKRVNRGVGLGLEIAVNYFLYGDARGVKNSSEKLDNELHVKVKKRANNQCMCFLFSQSIIHRVSAIKRHILAKIFTRCSKKMSAIANVRYIEVFPWKFDRDSAGSLKKCPLLPDVRYIAYPL